MTHQEFMFYVERRKVSIISALVRGALPPGIHFAVFLQLAHSDDPVELPMPAVVADVDGEAIMQLVQCWADNVGHVLRSPELAKGKPL